MPGRRDVRASRAEIIGWGSYLPSRVMTNAEVAARTGVTAEWIERKIGVKERRVAQAGEEQWLMGARAAEAALRAAGMCASELDLIVVTTNVPDHPIPSTSVMIQREIAAVSAGAVDLIGGCPSFAAAVMLIAGLIESRVKRHVLLVAAERLSVLVDWTKKGMSSILGDGAGALLFSHTEENTGVLGSHYRSAGEHWQTICMPAGGTAIRPSSDNVLGDGHVIHMDGRAVKDLVAKHFGEAVFGPLTAAGMALSDVDLMVPHQANLNLLRDGVASVGFDMAKTHTTIERFGNLSSASVPVALADAVNSGVLKPGMLVLTPVFGAGFSFGGAVIRWTRSPINA